MANITSPSPSTSLLNLHQTSFLSSPILLTLTFVISLFFLYTHLSHPLRHIAGPVLARYFRLWLVYHARKGDMHRIMLALHEKHGPLVRTGPNEVSVIDPEAVKYIYAPGNKFFKSDWYAVWQGSRKFDLFAERNEDVHRIQRRLVSRIYSMESMKELESGVDDTVRYFMKRLEDVARAGKEVDIRHWVQLFAFDIVGVLTFSTSFSFLSNGHSSGAFEAIDSALFSASWLGQVPSLFPLLSRLNTLATPLIGNQLGIAARHGSLRTFAATEASSRIGRGSGKNDVLEKLMRVRDQKGEQIFGEQDVLSMATSNIFAGSDTTSISICAVLFYLAKHPLCLAKLRSEIQENIENGAMTPDAVPLDTAMKMKYLQACMYEAMRLHPAVGFALPRVTPASGITVCGQFLPPNTTIGTNPWVLHRAKTIFGRDAGKFRPERWLESGRERVERYFFAFGAGSRVCIGRNMSWMEMSKAIPVLIRKFDMELVNPNLNTAETDSCWWFVKNEGIVVKLRTREEYLSL